MPRQNFPRDRFDDLSASSGRVGAHRAENPRLRAGGILLWAIAATIVLIGLGIFGSLILSGRVVLFPTPEPTPTATAQVTPVVDTSYTVLVLNAANEEGLATRVRDTLLGQGWTEQKVSAGNAGSTFETSTVYYASPDAYPAALGLARLLGMSNVAYDPNYPLPSTSATQLTVVLGMDRSAGATPTP
ncbi:LytR C-terminal domain-containing protein [Microbacterium sp. SORGH_AS_0888]|uniref:LytR C-terminal domain-containing protein n=1 Tax=Microbacterium sp. SORGH_AS_0888 TaxID=3041791 RepID=UPI00278590A1|nr:LytR C-terminal domain-containing protein [Microbacterium sp. SORGH_AS_0888]MDQ1131092.1 hypothetical protein [Microbacterium sp. SORGH_AS_0888]